MVPGRVMIGMNGGPGSRDPGQITVTNMGVGDLVANAYDVKSYQISGPPWMDSQRFDIVAKVPAGATKDDARVMWQNLLKERFGLALHHETKEMAMYALVVGKNGPKLKESVEDPPTADGQASSASGPSGPPPPPPPGDGEPRRMNLTVGKDGMPQLPAGMRRPGVMMMMMNGRMRMIGTKAPISRLVETLARQYDRPVTDMTGLTKNYDFTLDFAPENGGMIKGLPMPPPGPSPDGGGGAMHSPDPPAGGEVATLAVALQEQLGLKLEAKKGPVDLLVIDHLEKTPTEN
jgi:uncharacterized protein (TIGR03435 family)